MKTQLLKFLTLMTALAASGFLAAADESSKQISLETASARALEKHPLLAPFDAEVRLAEARVITALTRPNPELEGEVEDVLGSGVFRGFDSAIYTFGISQLLELGGKRKLRGRIAEAGAEADASRYEVTRREVILETARRYVAVLAAQAEESNARQILEIETETVESVEALQEGGRGSAVDVGRSELGLKEAQLQLENRKREAALARVRLAAMWGEQNPGFDGVQGRLTAPGPGVPGLDVLRDDLDGHPLIGLAEAGVSTAEGQLQLQKKLVTPDMSVGVAYRRDTIIEDNAVVLNFSLPLPFWNRNEGGIAEAEAQVAKTESLVGQARAQLELALADAHARLTGARSEYNLVDGEMLPSAEEHHQTLAEGYRLGRISFLELLEARRALTAFRKERIEALARYHSARVEIEALTGQSL